MTSNDIYVRPARNSIFIQGTEEIKYGTQVNEHSIFKPRCAVLRAPPVTIIIWPGNYLELNVPKELQAYEQRTIEPRSDTSKHQSQLDKWPTPNVAEQVAGKIRILNDTSSPQRVGKNEHICQSTPVVYTTSKHVTLATIMQKDVFDHNFQTKSLRMTILPSRYMYMFFRSRNLMEPFDITYDLDLAMS